MASVCFVIATLVACAFAGGNVVVTDVVDDKHGVWQSDSIFEAQLRAGGWHHCSVRRLPDKPNKHDLRSKEPFVFHSEEAMSWPASRWTRTYLAKTYGSHEIMPRSPQVLARQVPDKTENGGFLRFGDFIKNPQNAIFDRSSTRDSLVDKMFDYGEFTRLSPFSHSIYNQNCLSVGPSQEGFPAHLHGKTWQAQVVGRKLWILAPSHGLPGSVELANPMHLARQYLAPKSVNVTKTGQTLSGDVQYCITEPGDVIWFPDYWWHATVSIGESIGLGGEKNSFDRTRMLEAADREFKKEPGSRIYKLLEMAGEHHRDIDMLRLAYNERPTEPILVKSYVEHLLMFDLHTEALQVVDEFEQAVDRVLNDGLLEDIGASNLLSMIAFALTSSSLGRHNGQMEPLRAQQLNSKAVQLDSNNWSARMNLAHSFCTASNIIRCLKLLIGIPPASQGGSAAFRALSDLCQSPDPRVQKRCKKVSWKDYPRLEL